MPFIAELKPQRHFKYLKLSEVALQFSGAVAFGSRALNVHTKYSDYDYAILRSNWDKLTKHYDKFPEHKLADYFKVIPPYGNNTLIRTFMKDKKYDILLIEHQEHLDIIRKSVKDTTGLPIKSRQNKQQRINTYEKALLRNGFKLHWPYRIIKWFTKITKTRTGLWLP